MATPEFEPAGEWAEELAELQLRRRLAARMGGEEAVARHKARGRQTARERIGALLDGGSFREIGRITGRGRYDAGGRLLDLQPVNAIIGSGRIDGRCR